MDAPSNNLRAIRPVDIDPRFNWGRHLPALGTMAVDFEERVNYRRLQEYRIGRARGALEASELGALLVFDVNNIRYLTSTKIGEWERDKLSRWALLMRGEEPILWDFGSAAVHHKLYCPWLKPENMRAGLIGLRGTVHPDCGLMERHAKEIFGLLKEAGVEHLPVGVDILEPPMMFQLQKLGLKVVDGQQTMLEAREIKNIDEIALLNRAAAMVDGAYQVINDMLRPEVRENDVVAEVNKFLYTHGSDDVEAVNAISGERCNPHPHNFTDRMIRPGDQAFFDILQSFMGYRTCYYRTFNVGRATASQRDAYKKAREWLDDAMARIKPGASTADICAAFPKAEAFGFPDEISAFGLQFAHGLGLALHERPIISRVVSTDHPTEIKEGMVFAIETYCPATDGYSAARIEEEVVVTDRGCQVISVAIWNRTKAKADAFAKRGAQVVERLAELSDVDISFTMVSEGKDLEEVYFGREGLVAEGKGKLPKIFVDCSSISVEDSSRIRGRLNEHGAQFVVSPVSGNGQVIKAGKLSAVVSGPEKAAKAVMPLIKVFAPKGVSYVGDGELARVCKIAHNVMLGVVIENLIEITLLANKMGVPRHAFLSFMNNGVMGSMFTAYKTAALVNLDWKTTFTSELLRKDLDLGLELAREWDVTMPVTAATREIVQAHIGRATAREDGKEILANDFAQMAETLAECSGMTLKSEDKDVPTGLES